MNNAVDVASVRFLFFLGCWEPVGEFIIRFWVCGCLFGGATAHIVLSYKSAVTTLD